MGMARIPDSSPQTLRLLEALLASPERWRYGYELAKQTGLRSGTLYPILVRLAERGLLETRWVEPEQPFRPRRHTYRLTGEGERLAHQRLAAAAAHQATTRQGLGVPRTGEA
jgi:PadR family transcriptional regulator, regulatory protein PadR